MPTSTAMDTLAALANAIRTTLVLALVGFFAFGSLAGPVSAATGDHHAAAMAMDGDHDHSTQTAANCPAKADGASHDMGDGYGSCCVGTCTTILGVVPVADVPASRIGDIEPSDYPVSARSGTVEFLRPPSLTI